MSTILGIDPGLQRTGWGVVSHRDGALRYLGCGVIQTRSKQLAERLRELHDGIAEVAVLHRVAEAAVEETFINKSGAASLKLGQARGALLLAVSLQELPVHEYAATLVKKTVTGVGRAEKGQVAMMVQRLLPGCDVSQPDAADALAVAITHAMHGDLLSVIGNR